MTNTPVVRFLLAKDQGQYRVLAQVTSSTAYHHEGRLCIPLPGAMPAPGHIDLHALPAQFGVGTGDTTHKETWGSWCTVLADIMSSLCEGEQLFVLQGPVLGYPGWELTPVDSVQGMPRPGCPQRIAT